MELIPIMIKGMQELKSTVDAQQQKIQELQNTIANLKSGNAASSVTSSDLSVNPKMTSAFLKQNAPNPFKQNTVIQYNVPASSHNAQLVVFDMNGHQLKSYTLNPGANQVTIDGGSLSSGQYIYSLMVDGKKIDSKNMMLTR